MAINFQSDYSALYSVVGDSFSFSSQHGSGQPWRQQYAFNKTQSTDITGWTTGTSLPGTVCDSQAIVTSSRVYLLGGVINGSSSSTVYTAPINSDGTLGTWTTGTSLPGTVSYSQAIVTSSRVYLLGGVINGSWSNGNTVYTAPFSGGLNDYSLYYNGTITPTDPANFRLPDYTKYETSSLYYFIKT